MLDLLWQSKRPHEVGEIIGQGEHILVVEDDPAMRLLVVTILRYLGYRTLEVVDAKAALSELEKNGHVALLFTDVVLPGAMSGPQLARDAQRRHPELKVVFTSGYAHDQIEASGMTDAGVEVLKKPYLKARLARTLRAVLDG